MAAWRQTLRTGSWLTGERVRGYAAILLVAEIGFALFTAAGVHGLIVKLAHPVSSDFVSFYGAGMLADDGTPALAYDRAAHYSAEQQAMELGIGYTHFYYPPVFLLACALLARLPYVLAYIAFQVAQLTVCLMAVRRIVPMVPVWVPVWVLLAFPAVFWCIGTGQNALMSAALLAGATLMVDRRPVMAGLLFGALCYKPHFGVLLPVALAAGGHWRAFGAAAVSVAVLVAASLLAFGPETWQAFVAAAGGADTVYARWGEIDLWGVTSPFGLTLALGGSSNVAYGVQAVAVAGAGSAVAWVWRRRFPLPVRAGVLLAAMPIAVPIMLFYDLMVAGIALAWLVRAGRERGFPAWQKTGLFVLFVLPLWAGNIGSRQVLVPPAAAALVFALALRQVWHERRFAALAEPFHFGGTLPALAEGGQQR